MNEFQPTTITPTHKRILHSANMITQHREMLLAIIKNITSFATNKKKSSE